MKKWINDRNQWVIAESPARKAMQIFDRLCALRAQLERETEQVEFMQGDGIIDWYPQENNNGVHHPLLLLRLQLDFNAQIPEFTLNATEHPPELYTSLLLSLPEVNTTSVGQCRQEFEQANIHPLGDDETGSIPPTACLSTFAER